MKVMITLEKVPSHFSLKVKCDIPEYWLARVVGVGKGIQDGIGLTEKEAIKEAIENLMTHLPESYTYEIKEEKS